MTYPWLLQAQQQIAECRVDGRLPHACLITGPKGLGKVKFALALAADLLCMEQGTTACGRCRSCSLLVSGAHPDFSLTSFELMPKGDKMRTVLTVEQVRSVISSLQLTRSFSPRKVAVIHPAEAMHNSASNALLKMLEEPPQDTFLLLVSHDPSRLLATIRSRCQTVHVRLPDEQIAHDWLAAQQERGSDDIAMALQAAAGSPLFAQHLLVTGQVDQYRDVLALLDRLEPGAGGVGEAIASLSGLDTEDTWKWFSLAAATKLRDSFKPGSKRASGKKSRADSWFEGSVAARTAVLQNLADRNRHAQAASLHQDLLLRDWLIQWYRLANE